jgi:hypothetical protein
MEFRPRYTRIVERIVMARAALLTKGQRAKAPVEKASIKTPESIRLTFNDLKELLAQNAAPPLSVTQMAEIAAQAAAKTHRSENEASPLYSTLNPEGERDHPRPKLRATVYFGSAPVGTPNDNTQLTAEEVVALNEMTPGYYNIAKMDGSKAVVEVKGQVNANRELERLWILLPEGDEAKNLYPPLVHFAQQCSNENRVSPVVV